MKEIFLKTKMALLTGLISLSAFGQDVTGRWEGVLKIQGVQLKIVFNIDKAENGYTATMDSPSQGVKGIPVSSAKFENGVLNLSIAAFGVEYEGKPNDDGIIAGTFKQNGLSIPLELKKSETANAVQINRPQEPQKPYPYYEENVSFVNVEAGVTLAGTLTLPKKDGVFPAVILISGSGAQNRDEELMGHKPFLVLSDFLTRNGIAVLRYDDRGTAESTGDFKSATTLDFSKDTEAGVKYLLTRKEIARKKIGLIGHSEGGVIAPMVAARSADVAFIVMMAGTGIRGDKILLLQQEAIGRASGIDEQSLQTILELNRQAFDATIKTNGWEELKDELQKLSPENFNDKEIKSLQSPWLRYFIKLDPAGNLEKVKCPVLAINGSKDLQVTAKINLEAINQALSKGGNKNVTIREFSGLNHLFQECDTGLPAEYGEIEQTISPTALVEILQWIVKTTGKL